MTADKPRPRRKAPKRLNVILFAVGLFLDALVGVMTAYADSPPFDPVLYGFISGVAKAANLAVHYANKALKESDSDDSDTSTS